MRETSKSKSLKLTFTTLAAQRRDSLQEFMNAGEVMLAGEFVGVYSHADSVANEISQLTASGCGVTALLGVLVALRMVDASSVITLNWDNCILRQRDLESPLPDYLLSRSIAGCTAQELLESMDILVRDNGLRAVESHFMSYETIKRTHSSISRFISEQLRNNFCVVATLNLQLLGNDAWHHQLVYGVDECSGDIHCMNPISCYSEEQFNSFLSTPSCLLVRRRDVLDRIKRAGGLIDIYQQSSWKAFRVQEQIDVLEQDDQCRLSHIVIPANYVGGLCMFSIS
jgi:hypothetical protein